MKLKLLTDRKVPGYLYLANEEGEMLPLQQNISIDLPLEGLPIVTVQFIVDNKNVYFEDSKGINHESC